MFSTDVAMNSDAVRARNARKRAKLRAKRRGESPNFSRIRFITNVEGCTIRSSALGEGNPYLECGSCSAKGTQYGCPKCSSFTSQWLLKTTHDVSSSVVEYLEVYFESIFSHYPPVLRVSIQILVQENGQEREQRCEIVGTLQTVVADVVAAL